MTERTKLKNRIGLLVGFAVVYALRVFWWPWAPGRYFSAVAVGLCIFGA